MKTVFFYLSLLTSCLVFGQKSITGLVLYKNKPIQLANVTLLNEKKATVTNQNGEFIFENRTLDEDVIAVSYTGFSTQKRKITVADTTQIVFNLKVSLPIHVKSRRFLT